VAQQLTGAPSAAVDELRAERDQNHASLNDIFIVFQEVLPMDPRHARHSFAMRKPGPVSAISVSIALLGLAVATFSLAHPGARGYVEMVYVPQVGKVLMRGGLASLNPPFTSLGDTWWWDPADGLWTEVTTEPQPSVGNLALHNPSGTVVLYGGGETWIFDPSQESWTQLFITGPIPASLMGEQFWYHDAADVFVLFGGLRPNGFQYVNATWHFDLATRVWTRVEPPTTPRGRNYNAFAYDPEHEVLVMSGGVERGQDETWTYDPRTTSWTLVERRAGTVEVPYSRFVWDPDTATLVRIGGLGRAAAPILAYDLAANAWSELVPAGGAPHVSHHAATAVPGLGLVVYGGLPARGSEFTDALWVLDVATGTWEPR
jgi:hypothetical protein